ncbi:hypothetical protein PAMP_013730 [Pampus punctatissimus]
MDVDCWPRCSGAVCRWGPPQTFLRLCVRVEVRKEAQCDTNSSGGAARLSMPLPD